MRVSAVMTTVVARASRSGADRPAFSPERRDQVPLRGRAVSPPPAGSWATIATPAARMPVNQTWIIGNSFLSGVIESHRRTRGVGWMEGCAGGEKVHGICAGGGRRVYRCREGQAPAEAVPIPDAFLNW